MVRSSCGALEKGESISSLLEIISQSLYGLLSAIVSYTVHQILRNFGLEALLAIQDHNASIFPQI